MRKLKQAAAAVGFMLPTTAGVDLHMLRRVTKPAGMDWEKGLWGKEKVGGKRSFEDVGEFQLLGAVPALEVDGLVVVDVQPGGRE